MKYWVPFLTILWSTSIKRTIFDVVDQSKKGTKEFVAERQPTGKGDVVGVEHAQILQARVVNASHIM